jgi:hypothetical protein
VARVQLLDRAREQRAASPRAGARQQPIEQRGLRYLGSRADSLVTNPTREELLRTYAQPKTIVTPCSDSDRDRTRATDG